MVRHHLDRVWAERCGRLGDLVRDADDFVVLSWTEASAREALWRGGVVLDRRGLTLHPEKTRLVFVGDGRAGFDVLGYHHRKVESWKWRGRR